LQRYYPGYTFDSCAELTWPQVSALLRQASKRPYDYVVQVEPKK